MSAAGAAVVPRRALVVGLGVMGRAVARALVVHDVEVSATDDLLGDRGAEVALGCGAAWVDPPEGPWDALVGAHDGVIPSPGLPERHPVFAAARRVGVPVRSEFDLAAAWDDRPVAMITGTNGKTTVTSLVTEMLVASGIAAVPAGNVEVPLVEAIASPGPEAFVVEASSFRLTFATAHRPVAACWLNFAPDHLDVHLDLAGYEAAKARVWANHDRGGLAVANADDPVVMRWAPPGERTETFGTAAGTDWRVAGGRLLGPEGIDLLGVDELPRALPHDLQNALAAAATARGAGASLDGIRAALRAFRSLPHRVELVGEAGGVRWYDDSKATAPHATVAALRGFDSAVLIAGGRNKGLDLGELAVLAPHLRAVVAIGEAAPEVARAFAGVVPTTTATSMAEAVGAARSAARPGDAVVLSPACASFDWYGGYAERGDDFQREVRAAIGEAS
ncbi:MAG: UDP-N-acetylmuramoyl-L-alanine--D-glutamate ligase [Acidimicrobiales bacterium]